MGRTVYSKEQKQLAYEMYWEDRVDDFRSGKKAGKYSLKEIAEATGMNRDYISKIARGENTLNISYRHIRHVQSELCDTCWRKERCHQGTYRCMDYHAYISKIGRGMQ